MHSLSIASELCNWKMREIERIRSRADKRKEGSVREQEQIMKQSESNLPPQSNNSNNSNENEQRRKIIQLTFLFLNFEICTLGNLIS